MRQILSGAAGFIFALLLVFGLVWAGSAWRLGMAERDIYGIICQGLNTIWYGSAI